MSILNASDARQDFADLLNRVAYGGERIIIHRRGKNVAAIVTLDDFKRLEQLEDEIDLKAAKAALKEVKEKGSKSLTKLMQELDV